MLGLSAPPSFPDLSALLSMGVDVVAPKWLPPFFLEMVGGLTTNKQGLLDEEDSGP